MNAAGEIREVKAGEPIPAGFYRVPKRVGGAAKRRLNGEPERPGDGPALERFRAAVAKRERKAARRLGLSAAPLSPLET